MSKTLFDHLTAIQTNQSVSYFDDLDIGDQKSYNSYMINRFLSMVPDYLPVVNQFQQYGGVGSRESYLFWSQILPRRKTYAKYIKAQKADDSIEWVVLLLAKHFQVSQTEATEYLKLYRGTEAGQARLKEICQMYGTDPKAITKLLK